MVHVFLQKISFNLDVTACESQPHSDYPIGGDNAACSERSSEEIC